MTEFSKLGQCGLQLDDIAVLSKVFGAMPDTVSGPEYAIEWGLAQLPWKDVVELLCQALADAAVSLRMTDDQEVREILEIIDKAEAMRQAVAKRVAWRLRNVRELAMAQLSQTDRLLFGIEAAIYAVSQHHADPEANQSEVIDYLHRSLSWFHCAVEPNERLRDRHLHASLCLIFERLAARYGGWGRVPTGEAS